MKLSEFTQRLSGTIQYMLNSCKRFITIFGTWIVQFINTAIYLFFLWSQKNYFSGKLWHIFTGSVHVYWICNPAVWSSLEMFKSGKQATSFPVLCQWISGHGARKVLAPWWGCSFGNCPSLNVVWVGAVWSSEQERSFLGFVQKYSSCSGLREFVWQSFHSTKSIQCLQKKHARGGDNPSQTIAGHGWFAFRLI